MTSINSWSRLSDAALEMLKLPAGASFPQAVSAWNLLPESDGRYETDAALARLAGGGNPLLLTWSIGPVQGFIAQARRTADLWAGSMILSTLAGEAAMVIVRELGPWAIAFPSMRNQPALEKWLSNNFDGEGKSDIGSDIAALPNRFSAVVPKELLDKLTAQMEDSVRQAWKAIVDRAANYIRNCGFLLEMSVLDRQIPSQFQISWSAVPLQTDYSKSNEAAASAFNAMRAGRPFIQISEPGTKCFLCGERTALNHGGEKDSEAWQALSLKDKSKGFFRKGKKEGLCAVCLAKRVFPIGGDGDAFAFPSTHEISLGDFRSQLGKAIRDSDELRQAYGKFRAALERADEKLDEPAIVRCRGNCESEDGRGVNATWFLREFPTEAKEAESARQEFERSLKAQSVPFPSGYYAILLMDGDNVGKLLRGSGNSNGLAERHAKFSSALNNFALKMVPGIVRRHLGHLVYAGGDDVLAFLPAASALDCCAELALSYREGLEFAGPDATISAAIIFPHALSPVGPLLTETHRLLDGYAKDELKRNALAFQVMQRNGIRAKGGFKFVECDGQPDWFEKLRKVRSELGARLGSTKLYSIIELAEQLTGENVSDGIGEAALSALVLHSVSKSGLLGGGERGDSKDKSIALRVSELLLPFVIHRKTEVLKLARFLAMNEMRVQEENK